MGVMTDRAADRELPGVVMAELRGASKTVGWFDVLLKLNIGGRQWK
jgi:hypothetical protein